MRRIFKTLQHINTVIHYGPTLLLKLLCKYYAVRTCILVLLL